MKIVNISIVIFVLLLVFLSASMIVMQSIESEVSNFRLVENLVNSHSVVINKNVVIANAVQYESLIATSTCAEEITFPRNDSLIDFLKSYGLKNSQSFREGLAYEAGITNYYGTNDDNLKIINYVIGVLEADNNCDKTDQTLHFQAAYGRVENINP